MSDEITVEQAKEIIRCIHRLWYPEDEQKTFLKHLPTFLELHRHVSELFNFAGITSTLTQNNPGELGPTEVEKLLKAGKYKEYRDD